MPNPGQIFQGHELGKDRTVTPDYCVIGSGAGGSVAAAVLAEAGAQVLILEEGGHHDRRSFNMQEAWAYPNLYQEHGNRATDDLGIIILQGRSVGGGTTVNWTSSFRAPPATLRLWEKRFGVEGLDEKTLAPHFEEVEDRLSVTGGNPDDVNRNNQKLWDGAKALGWRPALIRRNVKQCARLGYCGMGCPLDAKQSALITYLVDAVEAGAQLYSDCRVVSLENDGDRVTAVVAQVLDRTLDRPRGVRIEVRPRRGVILAGGAINSPALLLRSGIGNARSGVGGRTFLHPTVPMMGIFEEPVEAYYGPPQSVACHHFADRQEKVGYFFETAPVHPMLASIAFPGFGDDHRRIAERLPFVQATIALLIDGHHWDPGGQLRVSSEGRIQLSYPFGDALVEAGIDALEKMATLLLAAGAKEAITLHDRPLSIRKTSDIAAIRSAPFGALRHTLFSAHQMGGCPMGRDPKTSVVNGRGQHHRIRNLWIADGSIFPTSLGVNPQLTIYAVARLIAGQLARTG